LLYVLYKQQLTTSLQLRKAKIIDQFLLLHNF
jgi:hypothetical protein